jgi:hypothetical protein
MPENKKVFLSGMEEIFARLVGLIIDLIFFGIYALARNPVTYEWTNFLVTLLIFWLIYELLSVVLFQFFHFFSSANQAKKAMEQVTKDAAANSNFEIKQTPIVEEVSKE